MCAASWLISGREFKLWCGCLATGTRGGELRGWRLSAVDVVDEGKCALTVIAHVVVLVVAEFDTEFREGVVGGVLRTVEVLVRPDLATEE